MTLAEAGVHLGWLKGGLGYGSLILTGGETQAHLPLSEKLGLEAFAPCLPFSPPPLQSTH